MRIFVWIFSGALLFASCNDDKKEGNKAEGGNVADFNRELITAWNARDSAKIHRLLADDVVFMLAGVRTKGKADVMDKWVVASLPYNANMRTSVLSTGSDEELAWEAGTFTVDIVSPDPGAPQAFNDGNYTFIWKHYGDTAWKLTHVQIEDLPLQLKGQ